MKTILSIPPKAARECALISIFFLGFALLCHAVDFAPASIAGYTVAGVITNINGVGPIQL